MKEEIFERMQKIIDHWNNQPTDYLKDYPYLTFIGRQCGLSDGKIREINEKIVNNKALLMEIYRRED